jgi:segregation and condensation protein A
MESTVTLEKFEGPLDVLLRLVEEQKMPIADVSLAAVTEQFLAYLDSLEEERSEALADFLVIASKLVYLKSKTLLPYIFPPEPDEGLSLADQLKLYKKYLDASKDVLALWQRGFVSYGRTEPFVTTNAEFNPPTNATSQHIEQSFNLLLKRLKPIQVLPQMNIDRSISVKQKIFSLYESIKQAKRMSFEHMTNGYASRTDVIISFLAILELVKDSRVAIEQANAYDNLVISLV